MKIRHAVFSEDRPVSFPSPDWGPSLTKQSFSAESDINYVVSQYLRNGSGPLSVPLAAPPVFGDVSAVPTFQASLDFVRDSRARFDALPDVLKAHVRTPEGFVAFCADPRNLPVLVSLGLAIERPKAPELAQGPSGAAGGQGAQPPIPEAPRPPTAPSKGA